MHVPRMCRLTDVQSSLFSLTGQLGGRAMSKDPINKGDQGVSRRGLLEKAVLAVGAATSAVAARTALARTSDVVIDSEGRVRIDGATLPAPKPQGSFEEAKGKLRAGENTSCANTGGCGGGSNTGCSNTRGCVKAKQQPMGATPKTAPKMTPKMKAPTGGGSRK